MSFNSDYAKLRKKRLEEQQKQIAASQNQKERFIAEYSQLPYNRLAGGDIDDIGPVATPVKFPTKDEDEEKGSSWFQAGGFEDGYQFGDVVKTVYNTAIDLTENISAGILGMGEKVVDAGAYLAGGVGGLVGADEFKEDVQDFIAKDLYDEREVAKYINVAYGLIPVPLMPIIAPFVTNKILGTDTENYSILRDKSDSLAQSGGELLGTIGLQYVGVPWYVTTGVTSFGGAAESALNDGANFEEAGVSAAITTGAEILTEKLFGGSGLGEKGLINLDGLTKGISNKVVKALADFGVDMAAEGSEEVVSSVFSRLGTSLYKEESLDEILTSEEAVDEYIDSFIGGAVLGGAMNTGKTASSIKTGRDYRTGLTENEQKVFDRVYNERLTEAEKSGYKLTKKKKAELYDSVLNDVQKGYIGTDTIEEVLGGETYKSYQDTVNNEEAILKEYEELGKKQNATLAEQARYAELQAQVKEIQSNSKRSELKTKLSDEVYNSLTRQAGKNTQTDDFLLESYNERARRGKAFEADLSQYDEKSAETVKRAVDSGILNNTRRTHEFVDMVAKISADKGVLFDFTNNAKLKESGFAIDGATVNGYVTKDGIAVNIDSHKSLNKVVGHEVAHVLEGTELYTEMQKALFDYAKSKNDYDGRRKSLEDLYNNVKGADIDAELTADLVGDYLFTDADFINNLSTKHRNVFQKIYDEIKYMLKIATAGSKEARELEKVKRAFDKAYKESGKAQGDTKYSLSDSDGKKLTAEQSEYFKDSKMRDENGNLKVMYHGSQDAGFHEFNAKFSDDDTSFFFVDSNDVAASYSGTSETYEAQTIHTAEDMNNFIESIGVEGYEVVEKDGKFTLLYEGDRVADSKTAKGIYEEFCWYEGVGEGDANYKVYLNLTNPYVVDAEGHKWNDLTYYEDLPDDLKSFYPNGLWNRGTTRDVAQYAKSQGYDGVIFKNIVDNGGFSNGSEGASTVAIAFESNQIKSVANEKPTGDADIRYSLSADSQGRELSAEQRDYFKDSKIVDDNGSLKVMYHGSPETFTIFDKKKSKSSGTYGNGFYFTDSTSHAATYGESYEVYLNITNPLQNGTNDITKEQIRKFVEAIAEDEDYGIDNYGYDATIDSVTDSVYGKSDFGMIMDLNISCVGNMVEAIELFNKVNGTDYNGIIAPTETVAFYPEQIKNVDNKTPTSDPDIRYSLSEYTTEEKKAHNKAVLEHFGKTYSWAETGYLLLDGTRLDLSGKHDGAPGGYRTVDHRDITEALGYDYGGGDYSGSLVQFMSEGNIRIIPECNGINLSVKPTKEQEQALSNYISRYRGEVMLDIDDLNGNTVVSVEYPYGTYYTTVLNDIREWFDNGKKPENSGSYSLTKEGETPKRYGNYNVYGEDVRLEAPIQEEAAPVNETTSSNMEQVAPMAEDTEVKPITQTEKAVEQKKRTPSKAALAKFTKKQTYSGGFKLQGAYNVDGKQYLSDGNFVVEFNDIDESIPHNKDFPIKKLQAFLNEAVDGQSTEKYSIDFDKIVEINGADKGNMAIVSVGGTLFDGKYIEAVMRAIPNSTFALSNYRGGLKALVAVGDNGKAMLMPVRAGDNLTAAYESQEIKAVTENVLPDGVAPMTEEEYNALQGDSYLQDLEREYEALSKQLREAYKANDTESINRIGARMDELNETISRIEADESVTESQRIASLDEMEAPPEMEAPYYEEDAAPIDPFEERDIKEVGNRKVKAYMYENPEVKPFFQAEAEVMLRELYDTTKGERYYTEVEGGVPGEYGSDSYGFWTGTSRHTSADIAYLLDSLGYTYDQIEKGLNDIIKDNGAENNACSKRIEFILNDRLMNGYQDFHLGFDVPPDIDYINLITEKQISEYSDEARKKFFETADEYAPPAAEEDIAPIAESTTAKEPKIEKPAEDIAPTFDTKKKTDVEGQQTMFEEAETEEEAPKVAKILTEESETPKKKSRAITQARANFLDKGSVVEDLALKTKNRELQAKYNFMHYSESRAQEYIADNLKPIVDKVEKLGNTEQLYEYMYHLHNIDRMSLESQAKPTIDLLRGKFVNLKVSQIRAIAAKKITDTTTEKTATTIREAREYLKAIESKNKPVFGDSVTADVSREAVKKLEAENPEFKELSKAVVDYNAQLRQMLVDGGVISQEIADLWAKMYPHYVPIRRLGDDGLSVNVPLDTRKTGINAPIKKATGGNRDILPLFDTMAMRTEQTFKAVAKNNFGTELMHTLDTVIENEDTNLDEVIDSFDNHDELLQKGKNGKNPTFTVFENGKRVTFEISEDMYDALKPTSEGLKYTNKVANTASNIFRGILTEYNPVFMASNAVKDVQDVLINSQHAVKTYANIPNAIKEMSTKGRWYNEYIKNGGSQNTYFDSNSKTFKKENREFIKAIGMPIRAISEANNFVERVPRLAEYIASRKSGASVEVAMLDAARVTTNFAAGGDVTKFLNRNGATFLNASVQGFNQQVRNIREAKANGLKGWAQLATKVAIAGLPAMLLNNLLWDDDEEYEELSDYVKDNYYVVAKTENGTFIRIPKGRMMAVIQKAFNEIGNAITGNDEVDLNGFLELMVSNIAPNNPIEDNILAPIMQVANNKTWYGEDLVPTRLQDLPAAEQYDESTDAFSKWLGEKLNYSPYKINYLLNQYSGGVGDVLLPMITPEAESGDNSLVGNIIAPLKDKFSTDSVMNNKNVSDFYDTMDVLTTNAKSSKATDEDILKYKYFNSVNKTLGELYAQKREIQSSDLPDDEKYEAVRELQEQINSLAEESLNTYEDVYIDGVYATVGDQHYRWYEPGEDSSAEAGWQKISDKQYEKQEDVTSDLDIAPSDYWNNKSEYDFAYEYPEKYAVAKSVGGYEPYKTYQSELYDIKADKDENGKSISGSRKEKVIEYVNNLDIDYGARLILFKNEYNADDTYNYEIIDYLNSREDISYEEMAAILRELGFTVSSDGTISWD